MAQVYATPGVYIEERDAFPNSVVPVATAIPAFIGYTQFAARGKQSLSGVPTKIRSFAEFMELFGGPPKTTYQISANGADFALEVDKNTQYNLFRSMQLFYANGGGDCYIVSVGNYSKGVEATDLNNLETMGGLAALLKEQEPTMVVIPDAVLLDDANCYSLQQAMLLHCGGEMRNRVAVLDVHDGYKDNLKGDNVVLDFRNGIGANFLQYGAVYYPWVNTTIVQASEVDYTNISNLDALAEMINKEVDDSLAAGYIKDKRADEIRAVVAQLNSPDANRETLGNTLKAVSPLYREVLRNILTHLNMMPPSAALAGTYSMVDNAAGVYKAPANVSLNAVVSPTVNITNDTQEDLNLPLNGKAVNAIRSFIGKGVLVWGARTLDGNSGDWRYINVRRTVIMLEQSIKYACEAYVFEPNTANTWLTVKAMIENFLLNQWKEGALAGTSPEDAYSVEVGLGITMTPQDILDGYMRVNIKVAISRPAEFIILTFQQQMQKS